MSRALFCLIALSVGVTGCQQTKIGSTAKPSSSTGAPVTPVSNPPPTYNPPPVPPPPPAIPTDETGGVIHQPPVPPTVPPPVTYNPPPRPVTPPPVTRQPDPIPVNPPPATPPPVTRQPDPIPVTPPPVKTPPPVPTVPAKVPDFSSEPPPAKIPVPQVPAKVPDFASEPPPAKIPVTKVPAKVPDFKAEPPVQHREPIDGACEARPVTESKTVTKESDLDILFVVDTSPSFRKGPQDSDQGGDLARLAADMPNFVRQLPNGTNYRIGVMTGNGPESRWHGKLVNGDEPAVLDSKKMSEAELGRMLRNKMNHIPDDRAPGARLLSDSQGEGMLLALYDSITDPNLRAQIQKQGLFRKNANLAIIVVSDEQDICWAYPEDTSKYRTLDQGKFDQGLVPVLKPYEEKDGKKVLEPDRKEVAAYRFCKTRGSNSEVLNYGHVAQALESLSSATGTKVIMNSITYLNNQGLKSVDASQAEFEMGHGILELVDKVGNGTKANMFDVRKGGKVSFASALSSLGATTSIQMRIKTVWDCATNIHPKAIDDSTIEASIVQASADELKAGKMDSNGQVITRLSNRDGSLKVEKYDGKNPYMRVRPANPSEFSKYMTENKVDSAKVQITFKTKRDVNPQTGKAD